MKNDVRRIELLDNNHPSVLGKVRVEYTDGQRAVYTFPTVERALQYISDVVADMQSQPMSGG